MRTAIVIPTYNRAELVVEAVESALAQTIPCRVVVVDDGSTDDTLERLASFGDRIQVLRRRNAERGAARNAGARAADDVELLCFLDADDVLRPGHVEVLVGLAEKAPDAPFVAGGYRVVDRNLRPLGPPPKEGGGREERRRIDLRRFLLAREPVPPSVAGVRRQLFEEVGGFDERRDLAGSEDWLLFARLLARGPAPRAPRPTALLRRHPGNTMADAERMLGSMLLAHRIFFERWWPEERHLPGAREVGGEIEERSRARLLVNAATQYYAVGRTGRVWKLLLRAARSDPAVALEPKWAWTGIRSILGRRVSRRLRTWKRALLRSRWGQEG